VRIRWTTPAAEDLERIHEYLKEHQPRLAHSTITELHKAIRSLKKFPNRGRKGREEGTRELLHDWLPHIVGYCVKADTVEILHIWHGAQDR
jgi:toxin ParE1/3/4